MKIEISDYLLQHYTAEQIFDAIGLDDEIEYHKGEHQQLPKRISIIHFLEEDEKKHKPTKNHMILTPVTLNKHI